MMDEILAQLGAVSLGALLMLFGVGFIFTAVAGTIKGQIAPDTAGRVAAGGLGAALLVVGVVFQLRQPPPGQRPAAPTPAASATVAPAATPTSTSASATPAAPGSAERDWVETEGARTGVWTKYPDHPGFDAVWVDAQRWERTTAELTIAIAGASVVVERSGRRRGRDPGGGAVVGTAYSCSSSGAQGTWRATVTTPPSGLLKQKWVETEEEGNLTGVWTRRDDATSLFDAAWARPGRPRPSRGPGDRRRRADGGRPAPGEQRRERLRLRRHVGRRPSVRDGYYACDRAGEPPNHKPLRWSATIQ